MADLTVAQLDRARRDPAVFAELLLGRPLWPHQLEVVSSPARFRFIAAGRQVGKSDLLAIMALHHAFAHAGSTVLIVSNGDTASKRLLETIGLLATRSPMLAGSVVDESSKVVTLSNGASVRAVPASAAQIRGWSIDLLLLDEAAFIDPEIWRAAQFTILARPGSRVVLSSSPWGTPDHFFRVGWNRGMTEPGEDVASFHWPSSLSPLVDQKLLEYFRETEPAGVYAREVLAEWTDSAGAYFTMAELEAATGGEPLVDVGEPGAAAACGGVVGGVDWGMRNDANVLTVVALVMESPGVVAVDARGRPRYRVAYVEERFGLLYEAWLDRLDELAGPEGFTFQALAAELNGVGDAPTQQLARRLWERYGRDVVEPVYTTSRLKEDLFGFMKVLMQQGRLLLPRHTSLLKQLSALEFAMGESGATRISVPERSGHDDCAMALALALQPLRAGELVPYVETIVTADEVFELDDRSWVP